MQRTVVITGGASGIGFSNQDRLQNSPGASSSASFTEAQNVEAAEEVFISLNKLLEEINET